MIDNLLKLRPLALLLVVIGFGVEILITLISTIAIGVRGGGFVSSVGITGGRLLSPELPVVLAVLLVLSAVLKPEVPRLRTLALAALVLTGAALGLGALFSLIGIFGDGPIGFNLLSLVSVLASATTGVVAFLVILRVFTAQPRPVPSQAAYGQQQPGQPGQLGQPGPMGQPGQPGAPIGVGQWNSPGGQPQNAPVWQPDQASGASWGTAQDAAAGNAGTWGGQGQSGWQPQQPQQPNQQQPWTGAQQAPQQPGAYPQSQPSAGWPQNQQPQNPQPHQTQPQPQQSEPPQSLPPAGWPQEQQQGYPSAQPQSQPSAGYPQSQPSSSQPEPQPSAWEDDLDDRTRLTPRVEADPQDPQPWGQQPGQEPGQEPGQPNQGQDERPW